MPSVRKKRRNVTDSKVLVVLTGRSRERLLREGGTSEWVLNPAVVRGFTYVVCVRHAHPPYDPGPGARPEPHGAAFLVGKISDLVLMDNNDGGRDRYLVKFDEIADVLIPDFWDGSRNPVRYVDMADIRRRGLDVDALAFSPVLESAPTAVETVTTADASAVAPLSIAAAKEGLAAMFGVPVEAIEITIKG
jgi:hypothetical protein